MVKKIKKYLKFVVCCVLMLSLMAPSYAALSASDGSAFVTKAEFDSALADFNARLTTFEAGINSKIDSQVTSYLDRNGIWSGKDQKVLLTDEFGVVVKSGAASNNKVGYLQYLSDSGAQSDMGYLAKITASDKKNMSQLLEKINKSGLLRLTFEEQPWERVEIQGNVGGGYHYSVFDGAIFSYNMYLSFDSSGSTVDLPLFQDMIELGAITGQGSLAFSSPKKTHMFLMFVDKDKTLYYCDIVKDTFSKYNSVGFGFIVAVDSDKPLVENRILSQKLLRCIDAKVY